MWGLIGLWEYRLEGLGPCTVIRLWAYVVSGLVGLSEYAVLGLIGVWGYRSIMFRL